MRNKIIAIAIGFMLSFSMLASANAGDYTARVFGYAYCTKTNDSRCESYNPITVHDREYRSRGYVRNGRNYRPGSHVVEHYYFNDNNLESALIGGAIGLGVGLIIGDSLDRPAYERPRYYRPRTVVERRRPVYRRRVTERVYYEPAYSYGPPRPWTSAWYDYCTAKYRSFDPESGTFQPHQGPRRLCR